MSPLCVPKHQLVVAHQPLTALPILCPDAAISTQASSSASLRAANEAEQMKTCLMLVTLAEGLAKVPKQRAMTW